MITRRTSRPVTLGTVTVGGTAPVSVQTMSTVNPADTDRAIADVQRLSRLLGQISHGPRLFPLDNSEAYDITCSQTMQ